MTPEELIAWHAHQITFLPDGDNAMVKHHCDAMHCVERLRAELSAVRAAALEEAAGVSERIGDHGIAAAIRALAKEGK